MISLKISAEMFVPIKNTDDNEHKTKGMLPPPKKNLGAPGNGFNISPTFVWPIGTPGWPSSK